MTDLCRLYRVQQNILKNTSILSTRILLVLTQPMITAVWHLGISDKQPESPALFDMRQIWSAVMQQGSSAGPPHIKMVIAGNVGASD